MTTEQETINVNSFNFEGTEQPVSFMETIQVTEGVECDVYRFEGDTDKDLGIIRIKPGAKTPLQRILKGDKTIEGYLQGKGKLVITKNNGKQVAHYVGQEAQKPFSTTVEIGDLMQWEAAPDSNLIAYEICFPPYEDGRYENIG